MIKKQAPGSFVSVDVTRRTRKSKFFYQINAAVDWNVFEKELYKVCKRSIVNTAGRPAYKPLVLFKMMLLQTWYNLSDIDTEDMVNESLAANAFCGLRVEDTVPDHSILSRFKSELSEKRAMNRLLKQFDAQLTQHGIEIQHGGIIDASITTALRKPQGFEMNVENTPYSLVFKEIFFS